MKIGIYGAGAFCSKINPDIPYIGVDGGVASLKRLGIKPIYIVGDFDSLDEQLLDDHIQTSRLPCQKDDTDTAIAIKEALRLGYDEFELYGVTGGRLDHFMAVCRLLAAYKELSITILDDLNRCFILKPGKHYVPALDYNYLSFFALNRAHLTLAQVAYPLDHYLLTYEDSLCVSNEIIGNEAFIETDGYLYCFQTRKGEDNQ